MKFIQFVKNLLIDILLRSKEKVENFFMRIEARKTITGLKSCGDGLRLPMNYEFSSLENIILGDNVRINEGVTLQGFGGIYIGSDTTLSQNVSVLTIGYNIDKFKNDIRTHDKKNVYIGDKVWLCANVTVCPGVKITGKYVVVAAGSVLTHDITEDNCVWGGVPAKKIKDL